MSLPKMQVALKDYSLPSEGMTGKSVAIPKNTAFIKLTTISQRECILNRSNILDLGDCPPLYSNNPNSMLHRYQNSSSLLQLFKISGERFSLVCKTDAPVFLLIHPWLLKVLLHGAAAVSGLFHPSPKTWTQTCPIFTNTHKTQGYGV